jgi:hypothetical protein
MKTHKVQIIDTKDSNDVIVIERDKLTHLDGTNPEFSKCTLIPIRSGGNFALKGFYLNDSFEWVITTDDQGAKVLLPYKR